MALGPLDLWALHRHDCGYAFAVWREVEVCDREIGPGVREALFRPDPWLIRHLERIAFYTVRRHHDPVVGGSEEQLSPTVRPDREGAATVRDLQFSSCWKRAHVYLENSRLVGSVSQPVAVGGKHGCQLSE